MDSVVINYLDHMIVTLCSPCPVSVHVLIKKCGNEVKKPSVFTVHQQNFLIISWKRKGQVRK